MSVADARAVPVASLYQDIEFHAKVRPHAVAVVRGAQDVSYATFRDDIDSVTRALMREQLPAGSVVAVAATGHYFHWLLVIGLSRLGLISVSIDAQQLGVSGASVLLTDGPGRDAAGVRVVVTDAGWMAAGAGGDRCEDRTFPGDSPIRVVLSSGTTGTPKRALITYQAFRARYQIVAMSYGVHAQSRFLTMVAPTTVAGWAFPAATWCAGGTVVLMAPSPKQSPADFVAAVRPTIIFCSPAQLGGLADRWPAQRWPMEGLTVFVGGAALPDAVNKRARLRVTSSLYIIYGSTEASTITMCYAAAADDRPGFVGYPVSYAQVQIVDEQDKPVAAGETGIVRTRGEGMAHLYLGDEDTTAACFRDGWFYPGDTGSIDESGGLTVQGRVSELINLGGTKISPDVIDEMMVQVPGVKEAASFGVVENGTEQLWIAIVAGDDLQEAELAKRFRERFPRYPKPRVVRVRQLPRNEMQKVMRAQLRDHVVKSVRRVKV